MAGVERDVVGVAVHGSSCQALARGDRGRTGGEGAEAGFLDPRDESGMVDALAEILGDPAVASRFAEAGRAHALSRFTIGRLVRDIDDLYTRLLAERGAGRTPRSAASNRAPA